MRFPEGSAHLFLNLTTLAGKSLAAGDFSQTVRGGQLSSRLVFHFHDGSVDDETTTFTQNGTFRLLRDHHVQHGPSFEHPYDVLIDVPAGQITYTSTGSDGQPKVKQEHLDPLPDLANGLVLPIVMNMTPSSPALLQSFLSPGEKARLVHLSISPTGDEPFTVAGSHRKATHFLIKIEIGGLAGIVAPIVGKKPADISFWIYQGESPSFVKEEGQFYEGGPIWRVQITGAVWPRSK